VRVLATASGALVTSLAVIDVFSRDEFGWGGPVWIAWLAAAYAVYRHRIKDVYVLAGGVLSAVVVVAAFLGRLLSEVRMEAGALLFIGLVVIGMSAAGGVWLKNVAKEEGS